MEKRFILKPTGLLLGLGNLVYLDDKIREAVLIHFLPFSSIPANVIVKSLSDLCWAFWSYCKFASKLPC